MVITDHVLSAIMCLIDSASILPLIEYTLVYLPQEDIIMTVYANWIVIST